MEIVKLRFQTSYNIVLALHSRRPSMRDKLSTVTIIDILTLEL